MINVHFDNIIVDPDSEIRSLFADAFVDISVSDYAAFEALKYMQSSWEDSGKELSDGDVAFVTCCLRDTIQALTNWKAVWEATVVAERHIAQAAEFARCSEFNNARASMNKAEAMRKGFDVKKLQYTLELLGREYSKIEELVDVSEEAG